MVSQQILDKLNAARAKKDKKPHAPIAKVSQKKKKEIADSKEVLAYDKLFYGEHWRLNKHVCECGCKKKLGSTPLTTFFHHLLPKAKYPQFRHVCINIMLLHPDCHNSYHTNPDSRPEVKKRQIEVIKILLP